MTTDELLNQIPANLEYSFTAKKLGYHYSCYLKIIHRMEATEFTGSSNELSGAIKVISEKLRLFTASSHLTATA